MLCEVVRSQSHLLHLVHLNMTHVHFLLRPFRRKYVLHIRKTAMILTVIHHILLLHFNITLLSLPKLLQLGVQGIRCQLGCHCSKTSHAPPVPLTRPWSAPSLLPLVFQFFAKQRLINLQRLIFCGQARRTPPVLEDTAGNAFGSEFYWSDAGQ